MTLKQCMTLASLAPLAVMIGSMPTLKAAQLHVEPILLEMNAPAASGTLTLRNSEDVEVTVQTRVQRWSQVDGRETLEPTSDVVASPPSVTLAPNADYVVRIVRVSKAPVRAEESYRVIVDQLPDVRRSAGRAVNLLIRQSIPVFFRARQIDRPNVVWSLKRSGDKLSIVARNDGDERLRIASLGLKDAAGRTASFGNGLIGYVLGLSAMSWVVPGRASGFGTGGQVSVSAETDKGQLHAVAQ